MVTVGPRPDASARTLRAEAEMRFLVLEATRDGTKTLLQTGGRSQPAQPARPEHVSPRIAAMPLRSVELSRASPVEVARIYAGNSTEPEAASTEARNASEERMPVAIRQGDAPAISRQATAGLVLAAGAAAAITTTSKASDYPSCEDLPGLPSRSKRATGLEPGKMSLNRLLSPPSILSGACFAIAIGAVIALLA